MKTIMTSISNNTGLVCLALLAALGLSSCSQEINFLPSTVVPGAEGYVKIKQDDNQNYEIKVYIADLAESKKLEAGKSTYVVWIESVQGSIENIGQLSTSTSMFSKRHEASVQALSSSKPSKVFITAENSPQAIYPSSLIVLTTGSF